MLVGLHGVGDIRVAEPLAHDLDRDAFLEEQAAVSMAQVMKSKRLDPGVGHDAPERLVDGVGVYRVAVSIGEDPLVTGVDPDRCELGGLVGPPGFEHGEGRGVEVDAAPGGLGLARV